MQRIWDEVGESDKERDKMLLQLEQECLDVYKRKVDLAAKSRAKLLQALANARVELTSLLAALGETTFAEIVSLLAWWKLFFLTLYLQELKVAHNTTVRVQTP